jgi:hypothetical protein
MLLLSSSFFELPQSVMHIDRTPLQQTLIIILYHLPTTLHGLFLIFHPSFCAQETPIYVAKAG